MSCGVTTTSPTGSTEQSSNFYFDVTRGVIPGMTSFQQFGLNSALPNGGFEDIWDGSSIWVAPTAARIHDLTSSSASDTLGGVGGEIVRVSGLNEDFVRTSENVTMAGVANVPTVNTYNMIDTMVVISSNNGANDLANVGNITATAQVDGTLTAQISIGVNQTQMAIFQVPANKTAFVTSFSGQMAGNTNASALIRPNIQVFGLPPQIFGVVRLDGSGSTNFQRTLIVPFSVPQKSILKLQAEADAINTSAAGSFGMVLVDN